MAGEPDALVKSFADEPCGGTTTPPIKDPLIFSPAHSPPCGNAAVRSARLALGSPFGPCWYVGDVAEAPDRQELLTALTTEHFTLQGARSQTASESASRASLYVLSVSSTLVALGFIGQASSTGDTFDVFALTVLPTLYVLGVFTFVRVVECGVEDFRYGVAINRIRSYYKQIAGDQAKLFLLSGHDDARGVFANAAVPLEGRKQYFTFATVVAVINSVVGGSAIAIALGAIADSSLGMAAGVGGVAALISLVALLRHADRLLEERAGRTEAIFPSP
jgi:hypothetical protein